MVNRELQQKTIILKHGFEQLIGRGLKFFTVENLASSLCMSKKTIYKYFSSKDVLVDRIVTFRLNQIDQEIAEVVKITPNPIHRFLKLMTVFYNSTAHIKIEQIGELKNRFPELWKKIENFRLQRREDFYEILKEAQEKSLVRKDLDIGLIATIYTNIINSTFQPEFFINNSLSPKDVLPAYVDLISGGLLTEEGHKFYDKIKDKNE
jgi:AcrR family transcriptional regulator